jgi:hypothetical protein
MNSPLTPLSLLTLALFASACSNVGPTQLKSGSKYAQSDALRPDSFQLDPSTTASRDSSAASSETLNQSGSDSESSEPSPSSSISQNSTESREFKFEEEPKREKIEIPVVDLAESGNQDAKGSSGTTGSECANLKGLAGSWIVSKETTALRVENFILMQDFDGMKSYSVTSNKTGSFKIQTGETELKDDSLLLVESNLALMDSASSTAEFKASSCIVTLKKDLDESAATYRVEGAKANGSEFTLKSCLDEQCKTTGEVLQYRKSS